MDLARARPARIKNTECCGSTVFLWVQYINDNNNWKQNIIFSQFNKHKESQCRLQSTDKKIVSGRYLWGRSDQALCYVVLGFTICHSSSHHKLMPRKPVCPHCCGLYTSHDFMKIEGLILSSLELVLCGSNCSDLNEVTPCN